jgi:O-antigen/teichoic acid export membrane protein
MLWDQEWDSPLPKRYKGSTPQNPKARPENGIPATPEASLGALSETDAKDVRIVAKGGAIQIVGQFTQKAVTFLLVAIAVRMLGTSQYGLYRQVFQVLMILTTIASGGFPPAAVRFIAQARATGNHGGVRGAAAVTLASTFVVSIIIAVGVLVWTDPLAGAFVESSQQMEYFSFLLRVGVAYVPLYAGMQVLRFCTQAYKTMGPGVMTGNVIQPLARLLFTVIALVAGFAVTGAVLALVVSAAIGMLAGVFFFKRLLTKEEESAPPSLAVKPILRFAFPQAGVALFSTQSLGLGILLVGIYGSNRDVGLYGVAQALQLAGGLFLTSIVGIFAPVVVGIYERRDIARLQSLYQTINRWVATFSVPVFIALIMQPEFFTRLLGGQDAIGAASLVPILAIGNLFFVTTGPSAQLLSMTGRPGINLINSICSVSLYVGLGVLFAPRYGLVGVAVIDAFVTAAINIVRAVEGKIIVGVQPFGRTFIKPVAAALGAAAFLALWRTFVGHAVPTAVVGLLIGALIYVSILIVLGSDPEERHVIEVVKARIIGIVKRRG